MNIYYTIYQVTNKVNGKIYIGAHKTKKLNDSYMGSGNTIKTAVKKYGYENFEKKILFILNSEKEMFLKEAQIVDDVFIRRDDTYNIIPGGRGWAGIGEYVKSKKIGIHALTFEERSEISKKTQANRDPKERFEMCSNAGKKGSAKGIENKSGIFGLSAEQRRKNAIKGNEAVRRMGLGFFSKKTQSELGKRGGPKNKGFIWYNDGVNSFKYTTEMQKELSFEEFLISNPNFKQGRPDSFNKGNKRPHIKGKRKFVTNGICNKQVDITEIEYFLETNPTFFLGKTNINKYQIKGDESNAV